MLNFIRLEFFYFVKERKMPSRKSRGKMPSDTNTYMYFYDVYLGRPKKIHIDDFKLKRGKTKYGVPYHLAVAVKPGNLDYNLTKFLSEDKYYKYKDLKAGGSRSYASACNRTKSGKRRSRKSCKRNSKTCSWVKSKRSRSGKIKRRSYCRSRK